MRRDVPGPGEDAESDPPVAPVADRAGRATRADDRFVGAAESRDIRELAEDDPIVDAWTVAAQGRSAGQWGRSGSSAENGPTVIRSAMMAEQAQVFPVITAPRNSVITTGLPGVLAGELR